MSELAQQEQENYDYTLQTDQKSKFQALFETLYSQNKTFSAGIGQTLVCSRNVMPHNINDFLNILFEWVINPSVNPLINILAEIITPLTVSPTLTTELTLTDIGIINDIINIVLTYDVMLYVNPVLTENLTYYFNNPIKLSQTVDTTTATNFFSIQPLFNKEKQNNSPALTSLASRPTPNNSSPSLTSTPTQLIGQHNNSPAININIGKAP
jgi:hypothetical protein